MCAWWTGAGARRSVPAFAAPGSRVGLGIDSWSASTRLPAALPRPDGQDRRSRRSACPCWRSSPMSPPPAAVRSLRRYGYGYGYATDILATVRIREGALGDRKAREKRGRGRGKIEPYPYPPRLAVAEAYRGRVPLLLSTARAEDGCRHSSSPGEGGTDADLRKPRCTRSSRSRTGRPGLLSHAPSRWKIIFRSDLRTSSHPQPIPRTSGCSLGGMRASSSRCDRGSTSRSSIPRRPRGHRLDLVARLRRVVICMRAGNEDVRPAGLAPQSSPHSGAVLNRFRALAHCYRAATRTRSTAVRTTRPTPYTA
jgi:hypothetical protein